MSDPSFEVTRVLQTTHLIRGGIPVAKENETLLTDASRTVDLLPWTVVAQIAASKKWVPWLNANLGATDGKAFPIGILMNQDGIPSAQIAAGDVSGAVILIGSSVEVEADLLIFDGGSNGQATLNTLDSLITSVTGWALRGEESLNIHGIWPRSGFYASKAP